MAEKGEEKEMEEEEDSEESGEGREEEEEEENRVARSFKRGRICFATSKFVLQFVSVLGYNKVWQLSFSLQFFRTPSDVIKIVFGTSSPLHLPDQTPLHSCHAPTRHGS